MSAESIAEQRRHKEVLVLVDRRDSMQREIDRGIWDSNGQISDYKISNIERLEREVKRINDQIAELNALEGETLGRKFCPEGYPSDEEFIPLTDTLARGVHASQLGPHHMNSFRGSA